MNTTRPHSALREIRAHLTAPPVLAALVGVAVVLGISGPFDTRDTLSLTARLAYWSVVVGGSYGLGTALATVIERRCAAWPRWPRVALIGGLTGAGVTALVLGLNAAVFGIAVPGMGALLRLWAEVTAITFVVVLAREMTEGGSAPPATAAPRLLDRVPLEKRGALVSLSVQDHYVEVITTKGRELLLMRLADAMREVSAQEGLQVHRSHWVALDQVAAGRRRGDGAVLTMRSGHEIPVSRRYVPEVRAAGLLPERGGPRG